PYRTAEGETIYHFDFYRLERPEEALDFGYEEYLYGGCRCLIEWPEKVESLLPEDCDRVYITQTPAGIREIRVNS
ncbi:MAG: tRNA (adenosine(37)-N6)-threonylcarbamoyltransferase complex ATPase subunit type 1 TsaE, partial [Rikenellaceae bacterium]|nr:tRNA (adenosine(37)-N6)-threonylcarbamoyltransferase complex ATPase subunit type 1 TsaE [Rikenellaceae bacterium]